MANVIRIVFFYPIHLCLYCILRLRHFLFDLGFLPSARINIPLVCIGNLELGGSGKTPMADFILQKFSSEKKMAFLSRGYGRKTSGFRWLTECSGPAEAGDEPWFLAKKWGVKAVFAVDENRVRGIFNILETFPETEVILLDDAFQHRSVLPGFSLLLTPFHRPFFRNFLFPAGSLRDIPSSARRADALVFTRAEIANDAHEKLAKAEAMHAGFPEVPVFVSSIAYDAPVNVNGEVLPPGSEVICIAGLADNSSFFNYCSDNFSVNRTISLPDHYAYASGFLENKRIDSDQRLLCTEKDYAKLLEIVPKPEMVFYLPIRIRIHPEEEFLNLIEKAISA